MGHHQRIEVCGTEFNPQLLGRRLDKAHVEVCIMGRQRSAAAKFQKCRNCLFQLRCICQHGVGNARQLNDLLRQFSLGIDKGLEALLHLAILIDSGADLSNGVMLKAQARGLQIEYHILLMEVKVLGALYGNLIVNVVDKIALTAIEDLDVSPGGLHGIRVSLCHAMVCNANGPMAPFFCQLYHITGGRQGIHGGHYRMQVQLHPLFIGSILPLRLFPHLNGIWLQYNIIFKAVKADLSENLHPHALGQAVQQHLRLIPLDVHIAIDPHRPLIVRQIKVDDPRLGLGELPVLHGEDFALHHHTTGIHGNTAEGNWISLNGLAIEQIGIHRCRDLGSRCSALLGLRQLLDGRHTDLLCRLKEPLCIQIIARLHIDLDVGIEHILQPPLRTGHVGPQKVLSVSTELKGHRLPVSAVGTACKDRHAGCKKLLQVGTHVLRLKQRQMLLPIAGTKGKFMDPIGP